MAGIMMSLGALVLAFIFLPSALNVLWKETHNRKRLFLVISAFFAGMLFIVGTLFKIQHWPMAGIILTLAATFGILFFIPALALSRFLDQENKDKRIAYILGALGTILFVAGMLFKIQHWPLANISIVMGIILLVILALPMFTWLTWKSESHISPKFIFFVISLLLIVVPGAMITLNLQNSYRVYYYPNNDQQNALHDYLSRNNSSLVSKYHDSLIYTKMEQLHSKTAAILSAISSIQNEMVLQSEGNPGKAAIGDGPIKTGQEILYGKLSKPFDLETAKSFLFSGCNARKELNSSLAEYKIYLAGITSSEELSKYNKMLDPGTFLPDRESDKGPVSLMSALHSLEIMKNALLTVESSFLNKIAKH